MPKNCGVTYIIDEEAYCIMSFSQCSSLVIQQGFSEGECQIAACRYRLLEGLCIILVPLFMRMLRPTLIDSRSRTFRAPKTATFMIERMLMGCLKSDRWQRNAA